MKKCRMSCARRLLMLALVVLGLGTVVASGANAESRDSSGTREVLLSGAEWKLGSFPMGAGEERKAYAPGFDESAFRVVPVPAEVQLTLGLQGMDLYRHSKELSLLNKKEWWYRKHFTVTKEQAGNKRVRLVFDGSDYFTTVWLNGEKLGDHEGAYTSFSFDITSRVKPGAENILAVKVTSPWLLKDRGIAEYMKGSMALAWRWPEADFTNSQQALSFLFNQVPASGNAAFTLGLIRDVKLVVSPPVSIEDVFVYTKSINADGSATLAISGSVRNDSGMDAQRTLNLELRPKNFTGEAQSLSPQTLNLHAGSNAFSLETTVKDAKLWWSWDMGSPNLYKLATRLPDSSGQSGDSRETTVGIRIISRGADMSYWLNGKHLLLKGSWYPMGHYYLTQNTRSSYEADLRLLRNSNANYFVNHTVMEKPDFYDLCDELGLMVMVQMPFNQFGPFHAMEPSNPRREPFLKTALEQGGEMVREHRNHPSIIEWAPLAESQWVRWAKYYGPFLDGMKQVVEQLSPGTVYHPSYCDFGEEHLWAATAGFAASGGTYQDYFNFQPAVVSEYGSHAISSYENLHKYLSDEEIWSDKNPRRAEWFYLPIDIASYAYLAPRDTTMGFYSMMLMPHKWVDGDYRSAKEFVDASQLYQTFIIQYASEAARRKKYNPVQNVRNWMFKDLAPNFGSGLVDFDRVPRMAFYAYKRAMSQLAVSLAFKDQLDPQTAGQILHIPVWVVNDHRSEIPLDLQYQVLDLSGRAIYTRSVQATVGADESRTVGVIDWTVPDVASATVYAVRATAHQHGGDLVATSTMYLKAVPKADTPVLDGVPKLDKKSRVLLIGTNKYAVSLASQLRALGADVDVINEDHLERFAELRQPEALKKKYDVIWLGSFEALWKVLDDDMAAGLAQAVHEGVGFIHSGGEGSFHGGDIMEACVDMTPLADVLPVKVRSRDDINLLNSSKDVRVFVQGWSDAGLKETGVPSFNEVETKPGSEVVMKFDDWPLLVAGHYGKGRTVAYMGYTPTDKAVKLPWLALFGQMLMEATGKNPEYRYASLTASSTPVMQMLKEQPEANVRVSPAVMEAKVRDSAGDFTVEVVNGERFARLVRLRMEWDDPARQPHVLMYDDNYFDLFPGEKKEVPVEVRFPEAFTGAAKGTLIVEGTNVPELRIPVRLIETKQ